MVGCLQVYFDGVQRMAQERRNTAGARGAQDFLVEQSRHVVFSWVMFADAFQYEIDQLSLLGMLVPYCRLLIFTHSSSVGSSCFRCS